MLNPIKKISERRWRQRGWFHPDTFTFPPAPCPQLCSRKGTVKRFHFSCLTCPPRRFTYKKYGHESLGKFQTHMLYIEPAGKRGFEFTAKFNFYSVIIDMQRRAYGFKHALAVATLRFVDALIALDYKPEIYGAITQRKKGVFYICNSRTGGDIRPVHCGAVGVAFPFDGNGTWHHGLEIVVKFPLTVLERICEL